ncbi:MAG: alpha-N-arabinofuranosidase [Promethearchaeota archaeon]|jgi:alpha-N-arabinofuranosidase
MAKIVINTKIEPSEKKVISKHIYGHFAEHLGRCIYDGIWVGENSSIPNTNGIRNDIVEALRNIKIPNIRWPGGCFADEYHWKDGIGPKENRPRRINTHWGGVIEKNHFGTHEFFDLCDQLNCEPYICGNVGSGSIEEMSQWIEYITSDSSSSLAEQRRKNGRQDPWSIKYWGVGNENWGCGGNMTAEYYSDLFLRYTTYCRNFSGNTLYKIACGPYGGFPLDSILHWVETIMKKARFGLIHGLSLHYYILAGANPATDMNEKRWAVTMERALYMDTLISKISSIMDKYDDSKKIGLIVDEWGTWWAVKEGTNPNFLYQQNTLADALVASLHLDIFNNHCNRVHMANIAQTVNVLQSMILTEGKKKLLTPTYHVFDMYKVHQENSLLPMRIKSEEHTHGTITIAAIHGSTSIDSDNQLYVSLCNTNPSDSIEIEIEFSDFVLENREIKAKILTSEEMDAHNTFDAPETIKPVEFPKKHLSIKGTTLSFKMPSKAVLIIKIK